MRLITRTEDGFCRLPAFIDAHVHVESSHLTPARFGRLLATQGTLTAVCDPLATLSFLALPVIPALKLTDQGLFACP